MILSNFINICTNGLSGLSTKGTNGSNISALYFPNTAPSANSFNYYNNTGTKTFSGSVTYFGMVLSSDNTPPVSSDYQVTNFYTNENLTDISRTSAANNGIYTYTQTVRNDGQENIIINTVGLFCASGNIDPQYQRYLITKTLLDTPVTVAPGETKTITITVNLNSFVENVNA